MSFLLLLATIMLLVIDWRQTRWIFANGRGELNPVIRWAHARWLTRGIDGYFAAWIAAALLADAFMPHAWIPLGVLAAVQSVTVVRNHMRGIRM